MVKKFCYYRLLLCLSMRRIHIIMKQEWCLPFKRQTACVLDPIKTLQLQFLTKKKKNTDSKAVLYSLHNKAEPFKLAKENEQNTKRSAENTSAVLQHSTRSLTHHVMFKRDFCEDTSQNKSLVEEIRNFLSVSIDTKSIPYML